MLPSVVASEVASALSEFVRTRFLPANSRMTRVVEDFLRVPENLLKGPYLSLALPFRTAPEGGEAFPQVPLGFVPWRHQRTAFDRLGDGKSTVVATGTGSGKTECFLLPILDYCRVHSGEPGIKAILIYPMNALANDQARRLARRIHSTPALRGKVTAGIYIGQDRPFGEGRMTGGSILSDRTVLVERPPDILLTNYKMLDYLLSRPRDQRLWRRNQPDTLRWLVVDELHTFDGAQGTDLACLIRRLKVRLGAGGNRLVCAGTSATLGDAGREELVDYVRQIFGEPFSRDSIVGESRQTVGEFLSESPVEHHLPPGLGLSASAAPSGFETAESYLRHQCEVFFGSSAGDDIIAPEWRSALGDRLRQHATFHRLLEILEPGPLPIGQVAERLQRSVGRRPGPEVAALVNGLVALISHARSNDEERPFLDVTAQLWVREMGRMVCSVSEGVSIDDRPDAGPESEPEEKGPDPGDEAVGPAGPPQFPVGGPKSRHRSLRHSDDLDLTQGPLHLPLVQCSTCRVTGWGAVLGPGGSQVDRDLRLFYNRFFDSDVGVRFLVPADRPPGAGGKDAWICGGCGYFGAVPVCDTCGLDHMVKVFVPDQVVAIRRQGRTDRQLSRHCPFCTARDGLSILGARSTVLISAALAQLYGSRYNDDTKAIAFSDNVQDAAHRAAFVAHRTWRTAKRTLVAQAVPDHASLTLAQFSKTVVSRANDRSTEDGKHSPEEFIGQFIAPDRTWRRDFKALQEHRTLRSGSTLPDLVSRRLEWEAFSEAGFGAPLAGSIQRARVAAVGPDLGALQIACEAAAGRAREEVGGLEDLSAKEVRWTALGILRRMLHRGAIHSREVDAVRGFLEGGCNSFSLQRNWALPDYGYSYSPLVYPRDLGVQSDANGTEPLVHAGRLSWYQRWVDKVLLPGRSLLPKGYQSQVLHLLFQCLRTEGLLLLHTARQGGVWAANPERFRIGRDVRVLRCANPARELTVPADEAGLWIGAPCLELGVRDTYERHFDAPPTWAGQTYRQAAIRRVWAAEHTALLSRRKRDRLQERFGARDRRPLDPNLLSATPTLEMGIDIGDLSTVVLCSVPPSQANYLQRVGRAGRRDGNAFTLTVAAATPHDLAFYASPLEMLHGSVSTPGVFLNASAVLERQLTSFCLDDWAASCRNPEAVPAQINAVLEAVRNRTTSAFPYTFFTHIARYRVALFDGFAEAFGNSLNDDSKKYLRTFLRGEEGLKPGLEAKILNCLERVRTEQDAIGQDLRKLRRRLNILNKAPDDEGTERDREEVEQERKGLRSLLGSLRTRDTFGFLSDEGLIPNYAFPEAGVALRSVILHSSAARRHGRARQEARPDQGDSQAYKYIRPASAALTELALENRFFAEGHRVTINRVNLSATELERWRLCPSCTHLENIGVGDESVSCPRCGDPMWADSGQVRTMVPLRLVHATTGVRSAQIGDKHETRDPVFFNRKLVAEPDPNASRKAFGTPAAHGRSAFGFEYVARTTFREMNFGPYSQEEGLTRFAGRTMYRVGFRICRKCGRVQSRRPSEGPAHEATCSRFGDRVYQKLPDTSGFGESVAPVRQDPDIVNCLYLYREFASESLAMLMPGVHDDAESREAQSFIAAVELGLKERFRGKVDHIRALVHPTLDREQQNRRNVLILYDTVPGGTGYLKDLANTTAGLTEVFRTARARIGACDCEDGCHRCVRAFRRGFQLPDPSRLEAVRLLDKVLGCLDGLEPMESIDSLSSSVWLESELEARFLAALRASSAGKPGMVLRSAIVQGRSGWVLTVNKRTWMIEPQANLGAAENVLRPSKPDFVIHAPEGTPGALPVAVFLDGFEYHRDRTGDDSVKRMALNRAGYLHWSLTWHDLEVAFGRNSDALDLLRTSIHARGSGSNMAQVQQGLEGRWASGPLRRRLQQSLSSFDLLLRYLEEPDPEMWRKAVFTDVLGLFDPSCMTALAFRDAFETAACDLLPAEAKNGLARMEGPVFCAGAGPAFGTKPDFASLFVSMPESALRQLRPEEMRFVLHLDDRNASSENYREVWNGTLRLFNLLQFLAEPWWTTAAAVAAGDYPEFSAQPASEVSIDAAWAGPLAEADDSVHRLLRELAAGGLPPPDVVGYELANARGEVVAEAELAWSALRVAVFREDQALDRPVFREAGWSVLDAQVSADAVQDAVTTATT